MRSLVRLKRTRERTYYEGYTTHICISIWSSMLQLSVIGSRCFWKQPYWFDLFIFHLPIPPPTLSNDPCSACNIHPWMDVRYVIREPFVFAFFWEDGIHGRHTCSHTEFKKLAKCLRDPQNKERKQDVCRLQPHNYFWDIQNTTFCRLLIPFLITNSGSLPWCGCHCLAWLLNSSWLLMIGNTTFLLCIMLWWNSSSIKKIRCLLHHGVISNLARHPAGMLFLKYSALLLWRNCSSTVN